MATWDIFSPPEDLKEYSLNLQKDLKIIALLEETRYLNGRPPVPKHGNLDLAWEFSQDPAHHHCFINMLCVSPLIFLTVLDLIEDHTVFRNDTNLGQTPVEQQLAVTLFRMGRYGNGASLEDIARAAGCSEGSVENYTNRYFEAILSLQSQFVHKLTPAEKEVEKEWMDNHLGFQGSWRDGWVMYDGTIVFLYCKPGKNGDTYYTRKANYGLNVQVHVHL
jgi:DNA-binding CsgD family transcriptional regulator